MSYYYYILYTIYSISLQLTINQRYLIKIHFCNSKYHRTMNHKVEILLKQKLYRSFFDIT